MQKTITIETWQFLIMVFSICYFVYLLERKDKIIEKLEDKNEVC